MEDFEQRGGFDKLSLTMQPMSKGNPALTGTVGGTFLSAVPNLHSEDIFKTVVLASIGATASFIVSMVLKILLKKYKK